LHELKTNKAKSLVSKTRYLLPASLELRETNPIYYEYLNGRTRRVAAFWAFGISKSLEELLQLDVAIRLFNSS
jgi:hypothetical protein